MEMELVSLDFIIHLTRLSAREDFIVALKCSVVTIDPPPSTRPGYDVLRVV
jgi:hypothetical protein